MSNYLEKDTFRMITNEALGGLHAGKEMKERILEAATHPEKRSRTSGSSTLRTARAASFWNTSRA